MSSQLAHVAGVPVEESLLALGSAGAAVVGALAYAARARSAKLVAWLRRR